MQFEEDAKSFDRDKAQMEILELEALQWATQQKDAILQELKRKKQVKKYDNWIRETNTRAVTS